MFLNTKLWAQVLKFYFSAALVAVSVRQLLGGVGEWQKKEQEYEDGRVRVGARKREWDLGRRTESSLWLDLLGGKPGRSLQKVALASWRHLRRGFPEGPKLPFASAKPVP